MTARIVDLAKWREDHPPVVRLMNITLHCWSAWFRMCYAINRQLWRL